ncbi:hypothetical protein PG988_010699 [Apiospora saccharicola]
MLIADPACPSTPTSRPIYGRALYFTTLAATLVTTFAATLATTLATDLTVAVATIVTATTAVALLNAA